MSFFSKVGGFLQKAAPLAAFIPGVGALGAAAIGVGGGLLQGNKDQQRANALNKKRTQIAEDKWNATAPLRQMGLQGLQNQQRPNLTRVFRNPQNPFGDDRAAPMPAVGGGLAQQGAVPPLPPPQPERRRGGPLMPAVGGRVLL